MAPDFNSSHVLYPFHLSSTKLVSSCTNRTSTNPLTPPWHERNPNVGGTTANFTVTYRHSTVSLLGLLKFTIKYWHFFFIDRFRFFFEIEFTISFRYIENQLYYIDIYRLTIFIGLTHDKQRQKKSCHFNLIWNWIHKCDSNFANSVKVLI